jgi:hypothetical protein
MRLMQSSFERPQYSLSTIYRRKSDVELVCDADPVERRPPHQVDVVQHDRPVHARQEHHRCGPRHDDAQPAGPPFPQVPDAVQRDADVAQRGTARLFDWASRRDDASAVNRTAS